MQSLEAGSRAACLPENSPGAHYYRLMRTFPNLTILDHPLIKHKLHVLRDKRTPVKDFRDLVAEIAMLMAYEVTKDLPTIPRRCR